ncbi:hypothetical protein [Ferroacidibacillus organovorans]|uniref:Uncharacterized protein n=1 Tax=Ferroacidibacillus organovorans TaxID=1765683 RepID=A0A101XR39_9BACL|nr:hypothetical protein [Ferroacidibacillus organovorans]KUO95982.1 hypothetical protein ATW55_02585 [Ferroacidibacillus organovorans]
MRGERILQTVVLALYATASTRLLYTGEVYRIAGVSSIPSLLVATVLLWLLFAISSLSVVRRWQQDTGGAAPQGVLRGTLYAVFAFPPAVILLHSALSLVV